jgi:hypothetical protein
MSQFIPITATVDRVSSSGSAPGFPPTVHHRGCGLWVWWPRSSERLRRRRLERAAHFVLFVDISGNKERLDA